MSSEHLPTLITNCFAFMLQNEFTFTSLCQRWIKLHDDMNITQEMTFYEQLFHCFSAPGQKVGYSLGIMALCRCLNHDLAQ